MIAVFRLRTSAFHPGLAPVADTVETRLLKQAAVARAQAESLPPGEERNALLTLAYQCEQALEIFEWLSTAGARRPD